MKDGNVKACHLELLKVILDHCAYRKMAYVWPSQGTLLKWYNLMTKRGICLRTLNYMLSRLEKRGLLRRIRRSYNDTVLGHVLQSTVYIPLQAGLALLERLGREAYKIMKKISKVFKPRKKRARRVGSRRARVGSAEPMGAVVGEIMKDLKPG